MDTTFGLDLARVEALFKRELRRFDELHPRSAQAYQEEPRHWLYGTVAGCNGGRATARCW